MVRGMEGLAKDSLSLHLTSETATPVVRYLPVLSFCNAQANWGYRIMTHSRDTKGRISGTGDKFRVLFNIHGFTVKLAGTFNEAIEPFSASFVTIKFTDGTEFSGSFEIATDEPRSYVGSHDIHLRVRKGQHEILITGNLDQPISKRYYVTGRVDEALTE